MKQPLHLILISLATSLTTLWTAMPAYPAAEVTVGGIVLECDTMAHYAVGPGTTLTRLHLSGTQPLDVHYFTIDLSQPGVTLRSAAGESQNGLEKTSSMASRLSEPGNVFFAGVNGDFYDVTSTYPDGTTRPRLTTYTSIIDNNIRKTSVGGYQFILDDDNIPHIGHIDFSGGTVTSGDRRAALGGVNIFSINYNGDVLPDNAVTVYTADGWRSTSQTQWAGDCAEVTASYQDITAITTGETTLLTVTSLPTSTGDLAIPSGGVVLTGRGAGKEFIESLSIGDEVRIANSMVLENGDPVLPRLAMGGNPKVAAGGVALESDGTRPDAVELHPRTGIGYSQDRTKVIMMVIDGRGASAGATTRQLGDLLVYAGAYEALNMDGGGSSTAYSRHAGVVNTCSDSGGERTVATSIFAVATGETESLEVESTRFADFRITAPAGALLTPRLYGYNAAGLLVDTDFKEYTLTAGPSLGVVTDEGRSIALGTGEGGWLKALYNGCETGVEVRLLPSTLTLRHSAVLLDNIQPYAIEMTASAGDIVMPAAPTGLAWSSDNPEVATVDEYGVVTGLSNGSAVITGENEAGTFTLNVTVEIAGSRELPFSTEIDEWKVTGTAVKINSTEAVDNGISIAYTMGASTSKAAITLSNRKALYSRPEALRIGYASTSTPKEMSAVVLPANLKSGVKVENRNITGESGEWTIDLSEAADLSDAAVWPIEIVSFSVIPSDAAKAAGVLTLSPVNVVYPESSGIDLTGADPTAPRADAEEWYSINGTRVNPSTLAPGIYIRRNGLNTEKVIIR